MKFKYDEYAIHEIAPRKCVTFSIPDVEPNEEATQTWEWYLSEDKELPDNFETFGYTTRTNYGCLWFGDNRLNKIKWHLGYNWHYTIQMVSYLPKNKPCCQTIVISRTRDGLDFVFMMRAIRESYIPVDFYCFYQFARTIAEHLDKPINNITAFAAKITGG